MHSLMDTQISPAAAVVTLELALAANMDAAWREAREAQNTVALRPYWMDEDDDDNESQERQRQETNRRHAAWDAEARRIVASLPPGPKRIVLYRARWWIICAGAHGNPYILPPGAALEGK